MNYEEFKEKFVEDVKDKLYVICSNRKTIRIAGDDKPVSVVKAQFMKVNMMHVGYIMDCMKKNPAKVHNIKQYLLAAIYNAPLTMQSYYQAWVNNDMAEGKHLDGGKKMKSMEVNISLDPVNDGASFINLNEETKKVGGLLLVNK